MKFTLPEVNFILDGAVCVYIYRPANGLDGTNNGVSSRYESMTLYPESVAHVLDGDTSNILVLTAHRTGLQAIPFDLWRQKTHSMFGANLAYTHDSRLPAPIKIFDRVEAPGS